MAKTITYQHYTVRSTPHKLYTDEWRPKIVIIWSNNWSADMRHMMPLGVFASENAADEHGLNYARRVIDGLIPGISVN